MKLLLTCEHAGNEIPLDLQGQFTGLEEILNTHRGYDPGALDLFFHLKDLADSSFYHSTSRLVVEVNRSYNHPDLFSEYSKSLPSVQKEELLRKYYYSYRRAVEEELQSLIGEGEKVLHLSVHSFTPILNGKVRNADIGLLYDPSRSAEKEFSKEFKEKLRHFSAGLKIRYNYPYLGKADGFTTYLRRKFPKNYLGIELEVNQRFAAGSCNREMEAEVKSIIFKALKDFLDNPGVRNL